MPFNHNKLQTVPFTAARVFHGGKDMVIIIAGVSFPGSCKAKAVVFASKNLLRRMGTTNMYVSKTG